MSLQQKAVDLEWEHFRDPDRYHALRDGPRRYRAVWVIERMSRYLPTEHVALAAQLTVLTGRAYDGYTLTGEIIGFINRCCDASGLDARIRTRSEIMRELAGFERAAATRVGRDGWGCYRGIVEGDGQAELARRVGYPEDSRRALRRLVQLTLEELQGYADECGADLARWNGRAP